jgi:deoxyribonuclease V
MIAALDVQYKQDHAQAAAVLFGAWTDATPTRVCSLKLENIAPYESGAFYKRELPCLLAILETIPETIAEPIDCLVVDSYVFLDSSGRLGLGARLHEALQRQIPVVGVAKTEFLGAPSVAVLRGESKQALFVSSIGMDLQVAAQFVQQMHGAHRLPTLLKAVDFAARAGF